MVPLSGWTMARPRKNRSSEYASLLVQELVDQLTKQVAVAVAEALDAQRRQVAELRSEVRALLRRLEPPKKLPPARRKKLGRWVPGGPGRPPKDAAERIAAFSERADGKKRRARRSSTKPDTVEP